LTRNLAQAGDDLDRAVSADPTYVVAFVNRANYFNVAAKPERALADANRAVELDPELPLVYFVRASAAAQLKDYDSAIADYSAVIKLRPKRCADLRPARRRLSQEGRRGPRHRRL